MPLRMFRDDRGCEWRVWEVRPLRPERRSSERRHAQESIERDRRVGSDRRVLTETRVRLLHGLAHGWLTFDCDREKRRLTPIPAGWEMLPDGVLSLLCGEARPTERHREPRGGA